MADANDHILAVDGLSTYFQQGRQFVRAVQDVSFNVPTGGRFGLAGESGSGKTQVALAIMGLVDGTPGVVQGDVWIDGTNTLDQLDTFCSVDGNGTGTRVRKDVSGWRTHREERMEDVRGRLVNMVFQKPKGSLSPYFTVGEQVRETVRVHFGAEAASKYKERAYPLLEQMEFQNPDQILSSYPHELSGGQSQRVMLALSLLSEPDLLIADEPTTLLDAITEHQVLELLASLLWEREFALLLITHDLGTMTRLVDEVAVMKEGESLSREPCPQSWKAPLRTATRTRES